ncbi:MAG: hypothetical protein KY457_00365 [Actinobacteria bacterium]|nr:hypothetical protein [Actinomycetota bacterium]
MHTGIIGIALIAALGAAPAPASPVATPSPQTHVVRAGASNPDGAAEPFVYTAYYPDVLQVHRGDVVRWEFVGSYGGWHTVTFLGRGADFPAVFRADEAPRAVALGEPWLHDHTLDGARGERCGRSSWWESAGMPDLPPCGVTPGALDEPHESVSSSIWDRFFSMSDTTCEGCVSDDDDLTSAWSARIDLPPGTYSYLCKIHPRMRGTVEVVADGSPLRNPSPADVEARIRADHANARRTLEELGDPARAWDAARGEWVVRVGADTPDDRVQILEFLPETLPDVQRGDRVRFVAGTQEINTVTFPAGPNVAGRDPVHGGFNSTGDCDADSCQTDETFRPVGPFVPYGTVGLAFLWHCEYDDPAAGLPGVPAAYLLPRTQQRTAAVGLQYGCPELADRRGVPEMSLSSWMANPSRAPGDLVASRTTYHNSGVLVDPRLGAAYRDDPRGGTWPAEFSARFPAEGTFSYLCNAHESMSGRVVVR